MNVSFKVIHVVSIVLVSVVLIGYIFQVGSQIKSFVLYFLEADASQTGAIAALNTSALYQLNEVFFVTIMSFILIIGITHLTIWIGVLKILLQINNQQPFSGKLVKRIQMIALLFLLIWFIALLLSNLVKWIETESSVVLGPLYSFQSYLIVAIIVLMISQIFKKGSLLQSENELTI